MPRHPVEDDPQPFLVGGVHEVAEFVRRAVPHGGREQADGLVAPASIEGILADRQQLDMGEAHIVHVVDQLARRLDIADAAVVGLALPRPQVDLVDRDGRGAAVAALARLDPVVVGPAVAGDVAHHAGIGRRVLRAEAHRVGLERQDLSVGADQLVLVGCGLAQFGDEDLPNTGGAAAAHDVAPPVPQVEVADHRNPLRVGCPDREMRPLRAFVLHHVRAENLPQTLMRALAQQVLVHLAHDRAVRVGVGEVPRAAVRAGGVQPVLPLGHRTRKQAEMARHGRQRMGRTVDHGVQRGGIRGQGRHRPAVAVPVRPENGERIVEGALHQPRESFGRGDGRGLDGLGSVFVCHPASVRVPAHLSTARGGKRP